MEQRELRLAGQIWFLRILVVMFGLLLIVDLRTTGSSAPAALDAEVLEELADDVVDNLVDVGAVGGPVDMDDPLLLRYRTIVLSGDVNAGTARQVISMLLYLDSLEPGKPIDLYVRTQGGWGSDAYAIADAMQLVRSPVNTWALGGCESAGAIVLAGGTGVRRALPGTIISIHVTEDEGDEPFSEALTERTREESFWRSRAKLPARFYPLVGDKFYTLSAAEALEFGIIDEIYKRPG
jgi:ATP-dependent Clp protease protease subunit